MVLHNWPAGVAAENAAVERWGAGFNAVLGWLEQHPDWEGTAAALSLKLGTKYDVTLHSLKCMEDEGHIVRDGRSTRFRVVSRWW